MSYINVRFVESTGITDLCGPAGFGVWTPSASSANLLAHLEMIHHHSLKDKRLPTFPHTHGRIHHQWPPCCDRKLDVRQKLLS